MILNTSTLSREDGAWKGRQSHTTRSQRSWAAGEKGVVYKAEDIPLGRAAALKFLPEKYFDNAHARERFFREAHAASALRHPNICVIQELGEHEGQPFIAMEYLRGQTLKQRILGKPLTTEEILDFGIEIAEALETAHREGFLRRELKPANIMLTRQGQAKGVFSS